MASQRTYVVPYRRRREGKTNYRRRLNLLKSRKNRIVVRKGTKQIIIQLVAYTPDGDTVQIQANSAELAEKGWKVRNVNMPQAYLTGLLFAAKAKKKAEGAVVDFGLYPALSQTTIYAAIKGIIDGGVHIPFDEDVLPSEDRLHGEHIAQFAKKLAQEDKDKYTRQFGRYIKADVDPTRLPELVDNVKANIKG
ncbi:MAG: 50S ribosomal protein L18 [Nanoarchaeota archaeon]